MKRSFGSVLTFALLAMALPAFGQITPVSAATSVQPRGEIHMHVIDVGTGLAILVDGPSFALLYDAGSQDDNRTGLTRNRVVAFIKKVHPNLTRLNHVILSHAHKDHLSLMPDVFNAFVVDNVWDSGRLYDSCGYRTFLLKVVAEGAKYHSGLGGSGTHDFVFQECASAPKTVSVALGSELTPSTVSLGPNASMTFLYVDTTPYRDPNENSVVVRLDLNGRRILLMGDAEAGQRADPLSAPDPNSIEDRLIHCCGAALAADVLVAGHHGSKTSSRVSFLNAVQAARTPAEETIFIISSGPFKYSGTSLPDREVVEELDRRGALFRTDINDAACKLNPAKVGPDRDGKVGGCENVLITISGLGAVSASYERVSE